MASQTTEQKIPSKITFRLGRKVAFWDPEIPGFDRLNALAEDQRVSATIVPKDNMELYKKVMNAARRGVLKLGKSETTDVVEPKKADVDKDETPMNEFERAKKLLLDSSQEALLGYITKSNDLNFLQILMELEMSGGNKRGNKREKVITALKDKIRELDTPLS